MRNQIDLLIDKYDLTHIKRELLATIFPCIKVVPGQEESLPIGCSKMGGFLMSHLHLNIQLTKERHWILLHNLI